MQQSQLLWPVHGQCQHKQPSLCSSPHGDTLRVACSRLRTAAVHSSQNLCLDSQQTCLACSRVQGTQHTSPPRQQERTGVGEAAAGHLLPQQLQGWAGQAGLPWQGPPRHNGACWQPAGRPAACPRQGLRGCRLCSGTTPWGSGWQRVAPQAWQPAERGDRGLVCLCLCTTCCM